VEYLAHPSGPHQKNVWRSRNLEELMHLVHLRQAIRRHGHPEAIVFPEVAGDMAGWEDKFYTFIYIHI